MLLTFFDWCATIEIVKLNVKVTENDNFKHISGVMRKTTPFPRKRSRVRVSSFAPSYV